tara:strand:- start:2506 stop:2847 length:342 start_codon:yes stop_codon:yes gene_type:complete
MINLIHRGKIPTGKSMAIETIAEVMTEYGLDTDNYQVMFAWENCQELIGNEEQKYKSIIDEICANDECEEPPLIGKKICQYCNDSDKRIRDEIKRKSEDFWSWWRMAKKRGIV